MNKFKKGDRVIVENDGGYDIGLVDLFDPSDCETFVLIRGIWKAQGWVDYDEIHPYTEEKIAELSKKYGYTKRFND